MRTSTTARSGACSPTSASSRLGVAGAPDHLVAGVLEQAGEALAQQHGVLGDHDAHGSSTAIRVPAPGGLSSASVPPWAATRSASPASPRADRGRGAADAVVGDHEAQGAVGVRVVWTVTREGDACLTALVTASQAMK